MMNMVHTTGGNSFLLLWSMHLVAILAFGLGFAFLVLWAAKTLTGQQLKTWGIGLVIAAVLLCALTVGSFGTKYMRRIDEKQMPMKMMDGEMMGHDMNDPMSMSMNDMAGMLEGITGDAFDKAFIEGMIPHHQGAIDMAVAARQSAGHAEIKAMAEAIISAQQREIDQMRGWQRAWGYAE